MFTSKGKIKDLSMIISVFTVIFCLLSGNIYGQEPVRLERQETRTDYSDEELQMFVTAAQDVMAIQQQSQHEMVAEIEEEGLTIEEFNQIFNAMQDPQAEVEATEEERQSFDRAMQRVNDLQVKTDEKIMGAIEESGLDYEEYEEIMTAYQQDPELQQRINEMLE